MSKSYKVTDAALSAIIKQYCRDLTAEATSGTLNGYAHAGDTAAAAVKSLSGGAGQQAVCITAEPGVGASKVLEAVAQQLADCTDLPPVLANARVLAPELGNMAGGARIRGQLEERVATLLRGLGEREGVFEGRKIVIATSELPELFKLGQSPGRGGFFESFAAAKGSAVIALSSPEFCANTIAADQALMRRFDVMPFVPGNDSKNLAESFNTGTTRAVAVRQPLVLRPKTPVIG